METVPQSLDLIDCTFVVASSTFKFDAKDTPDALTKFPDLFRVFFVNSIRRERRHRDTITWFRGYGLGGH